MAIFPYFMYSRVPNKRRVGKSASRVESKYFFSVSVLVLSVYYPTRTFSTLLVYLAPKSSENYVGGWVVQKSLKTPLRNIKMTPNENLYPYRKAIW